MTTTEQVSVEWGEEFASFIVGDHDLRTIALTITGDTCTEIPENTFRNAQWLKSVTLPKSLETIGYGAFNNCRNLHTVTFHSDTTVFKEIGIHAFEQTFALISILLPESIETIGDSAFSYSGLTSIKLPASITKLGKSAFYDCWNLISVVSQLTQCGMGEYLFDNCTSLTDVTLSPIRIEVDETAFQGCLAVKSITVLTSVETDIVEDGYIGYIVPSYDADNQHIITYYVQTESIKQLMLTSFKNIQETDIVSVIEIDTQETDIVSAIDDDTHSLNCLILLGIALAAMVLLLICIYKYGIQVL